MVKVFDYFCSICEVGGCLFYLHEERLESNHMIYMVHFTAKQHLMVDFEKFSIFSCEASLINNNLTLILKWTPQGP